MIGRSERVDGGHLWTLEYFAKRVRNMGKAKRMSRSETEK